MATHIASRLDAIMLGIRQQLLDVTGFPPERGLLCDPESLDFHPHGDQYWLLWPDLEPANLPDVQGSGRINCQVTDRFAVIVRTRFAVDESSQAVAWLTDQALGHIALRHQVWNALIDFQATDNDGNILNFPIHPASGTRPGRGWRAREVRRQQRSLEGKFASGRAAPADKSWGESALFFDVRYALDLGTTAFL